MDIRDSTTEQDHRVGNNAEPTSSNEPFAEQAMSIEETIRRCVIHTTRPIEHLPEMKAPELASIGRCVTLRAETTLQGEEVPVSLIYEGLISFVMSDCISLLHCTRFTVEDFDRYRPNAAQSEEREKKDNNAFNGTADEVNNSSSSAEARPSSSSNAPDANLEHPMIATTSVPPASKALLRTKCSMGTLPYVTFARKNIHNVRFSLNPPSSFYSLFQNPEKKIFDMQCLRMFVRRYLVHTSQGNNPDQITLKAFVACRGGCPDIDEDLLRRVAEEELDVMTNASAKIMSDRRHRGILGEGAHFAELQMANPERRAAVRPTCVNDLTQKFGFIMLLICAVCVGMNFVVSYGSLYPLAQTYVRSSVSMAFYGYLVGIVASWFTVYHGKVAAVPLRSQYPMLCLRVFSTVAVLVLCSLGVVNMHKSMSEDRITAYILPKMSDTASQWCNYFLRHHCSGWGAANQTMVEEVCGLEYSDSAYGSPCELIYSHQMIVVTKRCYISCIVLLCIFALNLPLIFVMAQCIRRLEQNIGD